MLHHFSHHNNRPPGTWISILMILIWAFSGVSALAGTTLPCRAECCCGMPSAAPNGQKALFFQKSAETCCCAGESGPSVAGCRKPISLKGASADTPLVSRNAGSSAVAAVILLRNDDLQITVKPRCLDRNKDLYSPLSDIPIYLQKNTFLC